MPPAVVALFAGLALATGLSSSSEGPTPQQRAAAMLAQMNFTEKVTMLGGSLGAYVGNVPAIPRLGIPALTLNDGPQGFRGEAGTSTCWPSGLTMAATWNVTTMNRWGTAMGEEFVAKGANVQLGPAVCLARVPVNGRNFEYLSGEDPYLGYTLVQPVITGIQSQGVIANVKHFINNNQETNRAYVSADLDDRTRWEMYMPPFLGAVEAGVWSAMCSYNRINGVYSCENNVTLGDFKTAAKFEGFVMSDWGATHSTVASAVAGLDQEMPLAFFYSESALSGAIQAGTVTQGQLDDKVLRILTAMYAVGIFDRAPSGSINANVTSDAHNQLAREFSREATVLVQNTDSLLPLSFSSIKSIAVLGDECNTAPIVAGAGSGAVSPPYIITVLQGILNAVPHTVNVTYAGTSDANVVAVAAAADVAVVCTGTWSSEGVDRADLSLPPAENDLIAKVAAAQSRTVVIVTCPGAVLMPWSASVASILVNFMPGQEAGNAVADVLFGAFNPSGRLPLTFPTQENPTNFTQEQYPGEPWYFPENANYSEGLFVGYRWYDAHGVTPLFPFGHGLSYTSFKYSGLVASAHNVSVSVTNIGSVDGSEVAQLYLTFPPGAGEPPRVLKGFQKVFIPAGATVTVTFPLMNVDLAIWDPTNGGFVVQHGEFGVSVGASSRDIRLKGSFVN